MKTKNAWQLRKSDVIVNDQGDHIIVADVPQSSGCIQRFTDTNGVEYSMPEETVLEVIAPKRTPVRTVGDMKRALANYPDDVPLDLYLSGEDRLDSIEVYREGGVEENPDGDPNYYWPMLVVDFG